MNVQQLIEKLKQMPPDSKVFMVYDGGARGAIEQVWVARSGGVLLAVNDDVVYSDRDRPFDAPSEYEEKYWSTPKV